MQQEAVLSAIQELDEHSAPLCFFPTNVWVIEDNHKDQVLSAWDFLELPK